MRTRAGGSWGDHVGDDQLNLFSNGAAPSTRNPLDDVPDAELEHLPGFLSRAEAYALLDHLLKDGAWRQDTVVVFGTPGAAYTYSGIRMEPVPFPFWMDEARARIDAHCGARFTSLLANLYRDGKDTVGWHADDEPELGAAPLIASLSLGATRDFRLKHRTRTDVDPITVPLAHGDLFVMGGRTQSCWLHTVPRRARVSEPRVNLTFRQL